MSFTRVDNPLNRWQQPTYHIVFKVKNPAGDDIIITQTGVTRFMIKDLEFESSVQPSHVNQNTVVTRFRMNISEPGGLSFIDAMYLATQKAAIINWKDAEYVIEISFKGYDNDGREVANLLSEYPNNGTWTWSVAVTSIDVDFDESGGRYTLNGVIKDNVAFDGSVFRGQSESITIKAGTVGEFFEKLTNVLNTRGDANYGGLPPVIYEGFEFQEFEGFDPASFQILPEDVTVHSMENLDLQDRESLRFVIPQGTAIHNIVSDILSTTKEAQQLLIDSRQRITLQNFIQGNVSGHRDAVTYVVHPIVTFNYNRFILSTGEYQKSVKFVVKPFYTQKTLTIHSEISEYQGSSESIQALLTYATLSKAYEYWFTGKNTEVLNADLNFNFAWNAVMPRIHGIGVTNASRTRHGRVSQIVQEELAIYEERAQRERNRLASALEQGGQFNFDQLIRNIQAAEGDLARRQEALGVAAEEFVRLQDAAAQIGDGRFAEDLTGRVDNLNPFAGFVRTAGDGGIRNSRNIGASRQVSAGQSLFGALIEQTYDNAAQGLLRLTMTIRGDPFWLGMNYEEGIFATSKDMRRANYHTGDACFLLKFRYPLSRAEDGSPTWSEQEMFNGVYRVNSIKHNFADGKFTQTLNCVKNTRIRPQEIERFLVDAIAGL